MENLEIERKFICEIWDLPKRYEEFMYEDVEQGYLVISEKGNEVRLRRAVRSDGIVSLSLTYKAGNPPLRVENQIDLTEAQFGTLWRGLEKEEIIRKRRYFYTEREDGDIIEINVFAGRFNGFVMIEVEFPSMDACVSWELPEWLKKEGKEVTGDPRYKMQNVVRSGTLIDKHGLPVPFPFIPDD